MGVISRNNSNRRIEIVSYVFVLFSLVIIYKLFNIQVLGHEKYTTQARSQYWNQQIIPSKRGNIYSIDGYPLATTQVSYLLYIEPKLFDVSKVDDLVSYLAQNNKFEFEDPESVYRNRIEKAINSGLLWVKIQSSFTPDEKKEILDLNIKGVGFEEEPKRYYPEKTLASHVLGFVALNSEGSPQGYFGIEGELDGDLKGKPGKIIEEIDALGNPILLGGYKRIDPVDGRDVRLTINRAIQFIVEKRLKEGVEKYDALSGSVIVMDPMTGDVLAMANYPTYDPANFNDYDNQYVKEEGRKKVERRNLSISQTYEPGSVIKALTVASAVDLGLVNKNTVFVDSGIVKYSDYYIDNWDGKHHGSQTISQLLEKSNNIGAAWVGTLVGKKNLYEYFRSFGLGSITEVDLEGEDTGIIRDYENWTAIDIATASFGQGISATPLQVINAFNVIANGGELKRPRIIKELVDGDKVVEIPVRTIKRVISKETSEQMNEMLENAVSKGEAKYFTIKNFRIAGKTGTAQIPVAGKYDPNKTNVTFVGYMSGSKKYSMIVKLEQPKSSIYAAETAVPLWMEISKELNNYFGLVPDKAVN